MSARKRTGLKVTNIEQTYTHSYRNLGIGGRTIYRERCKELIQIGVLYFCDLTELYFYAKSCELFLQFDKCVRDKGEILTYIDRMGNTRYYANPAVKACRDALNDIQAIGSHFGFQPLSRKKLAMEIEKDEDPVAALVKMASSSRINERKIN